MKVRIEFDSQVGSLRSAELECDETDALQTGFMFLQIMNMLDPEVRDQLFTKLVIPESEEKGDE